MRTLREEVPIMMFSLSVEELWELRQALDLHLARLEHELSRTENREYQHSLHRTFDRLDAVRRRLALLEVPEATSIA